MPVFIDKLKPSPAEPGPTDVTVSVQAVYTPSSGAGPSEMAYQWIHSRLDFRVFRALFTLIPCITLAPSPGASIIGTPSHPSCADADQNDRLPPGWLKLACQTHFHCIIGSQPRWCAFTVSSGVSPNDARTPCCRAPAQLGRLGLSNLRLPHCRAPAQLA